MAGLCVGLLMVAAIALVISFSLGPRRMLDVSWPLVILFIFLITPVHELLHAAGFEGGWSSHRVVFGFYPKALGCYAHYHGKIRRTRYIIIAALPLLVLTIMPLAVVAVGRLHYVHLTEVVIANGLASAVDVLAIVAVSRQVPNQSVLINSGMKTYWRPVANKPLDTDAG